MSEFLAEAKKRFKRCADFEATTRGFQILDTRFANGDSYNMYQWPMEVIAGRRDSERPCLTTNIIRQHNLQIMNDAKMNKPGVKFRAVGENSSKDAADIWDGIARRIAYESNFEAVIGMAVKPQVEAGIGYWRVVTEYEDEDSFNQVIRYAPIQDPMTVYMDPDAREPDKIDMKFCFIFDDVEKELFKQKYPRFKGELSTQSILGEEYNWVKKDYIRVAEYFYTEQLQDELLYIVDPETGEGVTVRKSDLSRDAYRMLKGDSATQRRPILTPQIKWCLIVGNSIVEERDWLGKYIPIVPVIGEETIIDGILDRKGHTRAMLDAQRMYNYWNSASVEFCALQTKTPWIAPAEAVESFQEDWANANTENLSLLLYNAKAEDGTDLPPPRRTDPPVQAMGYVQGAAAARAEMMMASGQYENTMGQPGNERTGKAISERQRQGDRATYHFIDNVAMAVRKTGVIVYDLVPKIYDTKRVMQLLGEDGVDYTITMDPNAAQALERRKNAKTQEVEQIFNPNIGKYAVQADMGPGYATRREEAWNAFNNILTQSPALVPVIGDLLLTAGDFPLSQQAAERLRRMVPKEALGEGPSAQEKAMQAQLQQAQTLVAQLTEENATLRIVQRSKEDANTVNAYKGQTERLKVLADAVAVPPDVLQAMVAELLQDSVEQMMNKMLQQNADAKLLPSVHGSPDAMVAQNASQPGQMTPQMRALFAPPTPQLNGGQGNAQ